MGATIWWVMGSSIYTAEWFRKFCVILKVTTLHKWKLPISPGDHPKLYSSPILGKEKHPIFQQISGMTDWMVQIGRFEILSAVTALNRFSAAP